ncbi:hypothetical protein FDG2_4182 [Candidatus Protofrankia californiensis]|uniref:Uncharacterized protein n=1 Tax=Candidatus Protofrankia californiensis TaxID=1839754 RepID=A0A1C3P412_9ACTN|nr:hypothetical protein FDG2_4182 [Candidatus Protofrankia californiensis]
MSGMDGGRAAAEIPKRATFCRPSRIGVWRPEERYSEVPSKIGQQYLDLRRHVIQEI